MTDTPLNYEIFTKTTEAKISEFMCKAERPGISDFETWMFRHWAFGAYWLWYEVTLGWQERGDNERLNSLLEYPGHAGSPESSRLTRDLL